MSPASISPVPGRFLSRSPFFALAALLATTGIEAARPEPITSYPPDWPHRAPWKMSREFLLPENERIVILVDVPRGAQPKKEALDHLALLAAKYGQRSAAWLRIGDPGAPEIRWVVSLEPGPFGGGCRARRSLDDPDLSSDERDAWRLASEVPSCPQGALSSDTSFVFVRYVGDLISAYGGTFEVRSDATCGGRTVPVIFMAQGKIAQDRPPMLSQLFLEKRGIAHEYGHVLGVASNPEHGHWYRRVPYGGGAHCVHRECAVSVPTVGALLKGQMIDYCAACVRDVEQAREHWRTGKVFEEQARLPQPDPAAHVARLKAYNFREGGQAERLVGYGKAVMPALMERLAVLSDKGGVSSPRAQAALLALKVVVSEDRERTCSRKEPHVSLDGTADPCPALQIWWSAEGERFMSGDDWELPRVPGVTGL